MEQSSDITIPSFRTKHRHTCGIYAIVQKSTGFSYVGSAVKMGRRWSAHLSNSRGKSKARIHRAIRTFGEADFKFVVLEECDVAYLLEREIFWIEQMGAATVDGFNTLKNPADRIMGGGHSEVTKLRMSKARKGKKHTPEHAAAIAASRSTPEAKAAISKWATGLQVSQGHKDKLSLLKKGKPLSKEHCLKLSLSHKGIKPSDEARAKMSASKKGRRLSEAHRASLSAAAYRRYNKTVPAAA